MRKAFGDVVALDGVDLAVPRHGRLAVVGPSGGGKSTLLALVAGLLEPDAGSVRVDGAGDARGRLAGCALMPQKDLLLPWQSALDNAILALQNRGMPRAQARELARPLFEALGLGSFEGSWPVELSGGMRQRVAFLRTLLAGKDVLLLDEPFGALDSITRAQMQEWLLEALGHEPRTVVLVTHDVEEALFVADRVAVLSREIGGHGRGSSHAVGSTPTRRALEAPGAPARSSPGTASRRLRRSSKCPKGRKPESR